MITHSAFGQGSRKYFDRGFFQDARFFTFAAAGAGFGMYSRDEAGMFAGPLVGLHIKGNGFAHQGAHPITNITAQSADVEAGFPIRENRDTHTGVINVL